MTMQHTNSHTWNEMHSQAAVWQTVFDEIPGNAVVGEMVRSAGSQREWIFIGCGTSFYLAEAAAISWTLLTGQPARAIPASEILLFPRLVQAEGAGLQAVVISRSGRTSEAVRAAQVLRGALRITTVGITCADKSELEAACDATIVLRAADEQSTVMTRSFTSMLLTLQALAAQCGGNTGFVDQLRAMAKAFALRIPAIAEQLESFVAAHAFADYIFLGQGPFHGIAREAALKVMEMSCSYSQFFHALEFRHGPKAIVSPATCLTFFVSDSARTAGNRSAGGNAGVGRRDRCGVQPGDRGDSARSTSGGGAEGIGRRTGSTGSEHRARSVLRVLFRPGKRIESGPAKEFNARGDPGLSVEE